MNFKFLNIIPFLVFVIACNTQKNEIEIQNKKAALSQNETEHVINKWLNLWETYDLNLLDDIFLQTEDLTYFSSEKEGLMMDTSI